MSTSYTSSDHPRGKHKVAGRNRHKSPGKAICIPKSMFLRGGGGIFCPTFVRCGTQLERSAGEHVIRSQSSAGHVHCGVIRMNGYPEKIHLVSNSVPRPHGFPSRRGARRTCKMWSLVDPRSRIAVSHHAPGRTSHKDFSESRELTRCTPRMSTV